MRAGEKTAVAKALRSQMTRAEGVLWSRLRRMPGHFRRQHSIGPYIADFASVSSHLVIEVDGMSHESAVAHDYDARRTQYLSEQGWRVFRVTNADVFTRLDDVVDAICKVMQV